MGQKPENLCPALHVVQSALEALGPQSFPEETALRLAVTPQNVAFLMKQCIRVVLFQCKNSAWLGQWCIAPSHFHFAHLRHQAGCELSRTTSAFPVACSLPWLSWDISSLCICLFAAVPVMAAALSRRRRIKLRVNYTHSWHTFVADGTSDLPRGKQGHNEPIWLSRRKLWVTLLNCKGWINSLASMEFTLMTQGCTCFPFLFLNLLFNINHSHY